MFYSSFSLSLPFVPPYPLLQLQHYSQYLHQVPSFIMPDPTLMTALGAVVALSLSTMGAAVASATSAAYAMSSREGVKSFVPIIISGVLGIYGLIVAVILSNQMHGGTTELTSTDGYRNFTAGLAVGFPCLASGSGISSFMTFLRYPGTTMNSGELKQAIFHNQQGEPLLMDSTSDLKTNVSSMTVKAMMMLCFLEALGLYGLIAALFLIGK